MVNPVTLNDNQFQYNTTNPSDNEQISMHKQMIGFIVNLISKWHPSRNMVSCYLTNKIVNKNIFLWLCVLVFSSTILCVFFSTLTTLQDVPIAFVVRLCNCYIIAQLCSIVIIASFLFHLCFVIMTWKSPLCFYFSVTNTTTKWNTAWDFGWGNQEIIRQLEDKTCCHQATGSQHSYLQKIEIEQSV